MNKSIYLLLISLCLFNLLDIDAQSFERTVLEANLENPWEITYGPDGFLWVSEKEGTVCRIDPETGAKSIVFQAEDYHKSADSEKNMCGRRKGSKTYGLALHPDFMSAESPFIYLYYSYNHGTADSSDTRYKIVELTWDEQEQTVINASDIFIAIPNGYDHFGGRMIAVKQNGENYLYFSVGDLGLKTDDCYPNPEDNPNRATQDPFTLNGKIHRIHMDGSIPDDNPIAGNPFFTRGHRNPQGLAYHPSLGIVYDIEHGNQTDDEINMLIPGMNYGWKDIQGYKDDGNHPGEIAYAESYEPHPLIPNDSLVDPLFSWASGFPTGSNEFLDWRTVAPSDGIYYGHDAIPGWENSLLVVTLKNGSWTNQEVFQFKLTEDGKSIAAGTPTDPNPKTFFTEDQELNGRLRDIAISPDGQKIFLITNNSGTDPIIVYTYDEQASTSEPDVKDASIVTVFPNPFTESTQIEFSVITGGPVDLEIRNMTGQLISQQRTIASPGINQFTWAGTTRQGETVPAGLYTFVLRFENGRYADQILFIQ